MDVLAPPFGEEAEVDLKSLLPEWPGRPGVCYEARPPGAAADYSTSDGGVD